MRRAETRERPNAQPTAKIMRDLPTKSAHRAPMMTENFSTRSAKEICIPIVMKKRPRRRPRKGAMSDSICRWYSVSASRSPARKAPSSMDRPAIWVSSLVPSATSSVVARNTSAFCVEAIRL